MAALQHLSKRHMYQAVGALTFLFALVTTLSSPASSDYWRQSTSGAQDLSPNLELEDQLLEQYVAHIASPIAIDAEQYSLFGMQEWNLTAQPRWKEPFGEQLCVVDLDSRSLDQPGQVWGNTSMTWQRPNEVHGMSLGILNHWLYAKIHGYKYYHVQVDPFSDRYSTWKKPTIISSILKRHEVCVYIDVDAIFEHLDLPFEWLMNYWRLDSTQHSLALSFDPNFDWNRDRLGKLHLNTGFIVAQNTAKTFEIMNAWHNCPDINGSHPECAQFASKFPGKLTDQGAFGNHIRYDFPDDIRELPCQEANGYPQSDTDCSGDFIRHYWTAKRTWIKLAVGKQMPGDLLEVFHRLFVSEKASFLRSEQDLTAPAIL